jgi:S1-C subfamily serine protease
MRGLAVLFLFLASCSPAPEAGLKLVTIDNAETGLSLRELPPETLRSIGLAYGLAVVRTGGLGERAGLKVGDVVYGINQRKVKNFAEFNRLLAQQGGRLGLLVRRGLIDLYVPVDLAAAAREGPPKGLPGVRDTLLRT